MTPTATLRKDVLAMWVQVENVSLAGTTSSLGAGHGHGNVKLKRRSVELLELGELDCTWLAGSGSKEESRDGRYWRRR